MLACDCFTKKENVKSQIDIWHLNIIIFANSRRLLSETIAWELIDIGRVYFPQILFVISWYQRNLEEILKEKPFDPLIPSMKR